jgi:translation initiation factor 2 beta subunit (eIF-2beta)/eIF-5
MMYSFVLQYILSVTWYTLQNPQHVIDFGCSLVASTGSIITSFQVIVYNKQTSSDMQNVMCSYTAVQMIKIYNINY